MYRGLAIKLIAASDKDHVCYLEFVMFGTFSTQQHPSYTGAEDSPSIQQPLLIAKAKSPKYS